MKTVLVSRFNWPHPVWENNYGSEYQCWIEDRLDLFRNYTIKSLRNCYVKPDLWVILIADVSEGLAGKLESLLVGFNYKIVVYDGRGLSETIRSALEDLTYPEEIRMTRLDTDDLLASDFFAKVSEVVLPDEILEDGVALSFPGGANYSTNEKAFYFSSYPANPFLTYAQRVGSSGELNTVFMCMHIDLLKVAKHQHMIRSYHPMWASVIHSTNLANDSLIETNRVAFNDQSYIRKKFGV